MSLLRRRASFGGRVAAYGDIIIADGPMHFYRCDEQSGTSLADAVGGADMTLTGAYALGGASFNGDSSKCLTLAGGYASIAQAILAQPNARPVTLELWCYPTSNSVGVFLHQSNTSGQVNASLQYRGGETPSSFRFDKFPPSNVYLESAAYAINQCYYLIYEETATTRKIWVNNALVASDNAPENYTGNIVTHTGLGAVPVSGGAPFYGRLKDVAIYNKKLTQDQRDAHWAAGKL